jgi:hypothetical protein
MEEPHLGTVLSPSMSRSISSVVGSPLYRNTICLAVLTLSSLIETSTGIIRLEIAIHKSRIFLSGCILSCIFAVAVQHRLRLDCFLQCFFRAIRSIQRRTASNVLPNRFVEHLFSGIRQRQRYFRSGPASWPRKPEIECYLPQKRNRSPEGQCLINALPGQVVFTPHSPGHVGVFA